MKIHGLQKMTLLDYPGKVACTVFTAGCNFRCPFCHNAALVTQIRPETAYETEEVLSFLKKRRGLLDGVCITGGEPMAQSDIGEFVRVVKEMGYFVKVDTNGSFPERLEELLAEGHVDYVAMDVKNAPGKYAMTAGVTEDILPRVSRSVALLLGGSVDYEFRTTVAAELHTAEDIGIIGQWIAGAKRYFLQPFKDSGALVGAQALSAPEKAELMRMRDAAAPYVSRVEVRGLS